MILRVAEQPYTNQNNKLNMRVVFNEMTEIYVKVEPGSEKFQVENNSIPKIYLTEPAENGRANTQLIKKLETITGEKPGIISGHKSKRKKLAINISEKEFKNKLK